MMVEAPSADGSLAFFGTSHDKMAAQQHAQPSIDFERFFQHSLDLLIVAGLDGYFRRVNPAFCGFVGRSETQILAQPFWNLVHPDDLGKVRDAIDLLGTGHLTFLEVRLIQADDGYCPVKWAAYPDRETGLIYAAARSDLPNSHEREHTGLPVDTSPTPLLVINETGMTRYANRRAELALAASRTELPVGVGLNPVWLEGNVVVASVIGTRLQKQVVQQLIEERGRLERDKTRLRRLAERDALTGLYNRRGFERILLSELADARARLESVSIISLDVDEFKSYNDCFGHLSGDMALKEIADLLVSNVRKNDAVGRLGGEEFFVSLPRADRGESRHFGERLRSVVESHMGFECAVTVSVGAATFDFKKRWIALKRVKAQMDQEADRALYHSKTMGRNLFTHFDDI